MKELHLPVTTTKYNSFICNMTWLVHYSFYNLLTQHERGIQAITIQQLMSWYDSHDSQTSEDVQVELRLLTYKTWL